jgi:hypothetical protein
MLPWSALPPGRTAGGLLLVLLAAGAGPAAASGQRVEGRFLGHVPVRLTPAAGDHYYHFTPQHLADDASLLSLHFDFFGIPWQELESGSPLPGAWTDQMDQIDALRQDLGLPVLLSLTPLSGTRDRLAPRAYGPGPRLLFDDSFGAQCEAIGSRPDAAQVEAAYDAYVDYMVDRFDPAYLAISIEVNLYRYLCPGAWDDLVAFLDRVYERQKVRHPNLPVFHTFQADFLWEALSPGARCVGFDRSCLEENLAAMSALEGDVFALSTYPWGTRVVNQGLPEDYLTVFRGLSGKPVAVAETGYQVYSLQEVDPDHPGQCITTLPSSLQDQEWWMGRLLASADAVKMPFVVWWSDQDLMPEYASVPCVCEVEGDPFCAVLSQAPPDDAKLLRSFSTMGVRDWEGNPRPSLALWQAAVGEHRVPEPPPGTPYLSSPDFPDFRFQVVIDRGDDLLAGSPESGCLAETLCVSGALPGRTELLIRVIGPRPNGHLWVNLVRFTPSRLLVWIEQRSSGQTNYYELDAVPRGGEDLPGRLDTTAFLP